MRKAQHKVVLMSIKPKWAEEIYSGKKTVEFRKRAPAVGSIVFLYESAPVQSITGCFFASAVIESDAVETWCMIKVLKGIWEPGSMDRNALYDYAGGEDGLCCAIRTQSPLRLPDAGKLHLEKYAVRPPQSWQYLRPDHAGENALARELLHCLKKTFAAEKGEVAHG